MAAEGGFVIDDSFVAGVGGATQFTFARTTGAEAATLCVGSSGLTGAAVGVFQDAATSGQATQVRLLGRTKLLAGAAVTAGDRLASSTGGTAITASTTGQLVRAIAINGASTAAGQVIDALLIPGYIIMGSTA